MQPIKSMSRKRNVTATRAFERRESGGYPYFKLATWDDRNMTWKDGRGSFETEGDAYGSVAGRPGRYRVSRVEESGRVDLIPFAF